MKLMTATKVNTVMIRKVQAPQTSEQNKTRKRVKDALVADNTTDNVGDNKGLLGLLTEFVMVAGDFV